MSNELIINSTQDGERIALLLDKRLVEYHHEKSDTNYTVGDIFLGSVKKVIILDTLHASPSATASAGPQTGKLFPAKSLGERS